MQSGAHFTAPPAQPQPAPAADGQAGALPALFWDAAPAEGAQHADQAAMDAMMAELGPLEKALNFKVREVPPALAVHPIPWIHLGIAVVGAASRKVGGRSPVVPHN